MTELFSEHRQSFAEIRRLALLCHGLDLSSTNLNDGSCQYAIGNRAKVILHEQISCNLLALAVSLRVNFYQKQLLDLATFDVRDYAGMYWEDNMYIDKTTVRDVCDKIIHADVFSKSVLPKAISKGAYATIQMKGKLRNRKWTLDLCVAVFCEKILYLLDEVDSYA